MSAVAFERSVLETSRATEYLNARELQAQTGQPIERFASVVLKELIDNGLDASETAGRAPAITVTVSEQDTISLTVQDNGPGIPADVVGRILNFTTRTSDKAAYRSPARGAQGNALKTVLGIPYALGSEEPVSIEAQGVRHTISVWSDPAGELRVNHTKEHRPTLEGTRVSVTLPAKGQRFRPRYWTRAFALFNPHASVKIRTQRGDSQLAHSAEIPEPTTENFYHSLVQFPEAWRKFLPTDLSSPYWYDDDALARLVFAYIAHAERGGKDLTLRDFVRQFRGLSGTGKAKRVCDHFPRITHVSDFQSTPERVRELLQIMGQETTPPSAGVLGCIGEEQFRSRFATWYGIKRFWYKKAADVIDDIPFVVEAALAETTRQGAFFTGVNFSPTFGDPFADMELESPEFLTYGINSFLERGHASPEPDRWHGPATHTAAAVHFVCPVVNFLDRGKTRLTVSDAIAEQVAKVLWSVVRALYKEEERRRKDAARVERQRQQRDRQETHPHVPLNRLVFELIPSVYEDETEQETHDLSSRDFYYAIRRHLQRYTDKELDFNSFSRTKSSTSIPSRRNSCRSTGNTTALFLRSTTNPVVFCTSRTPDEKSP